MHQNDRGARILRRHDVARYQVVEDRFYDPIRSMDRKAQSVQFARDGQA